MAAVSNTTPLNYLLLIDAVHLLPALYGQISVPSTVLQEMLHVKAPQKVRDFASSPPAWIRIEPDLLVQSLDLLALHAGEAQAIQLYELLQADVLLTDDKPARRAAEKRGIRVATTLLVLSAAADKGWIDLRDAVARLERTNFRIDIALIHQLLDRRS